MRLNVDTGQVRCRYISGRSTLRGPDGPPCARYVIDQARSRPIRVNRNRYTGAGWPHAYAPARLMPSSRPGALLGALAHLPALALEAARALLLPLPAHLGVSLLPRIGLVPTTTEAQHQVQRRFLLDVVVRESAAILKLLARKDQALLIWGDALLVLDLRLDVVDRVGRLDLERDRLAREGLDENLHGPRPAAARSRARQHGSHVPTAFCTLA